MGKVKAIVFSDLHYDDWASLKNKTTFENIPRAVMQIISEQCTKYNCSALFCGDIFDKPQSISNSVFNNFLEDYYKLFELNGINLYAISGNHDQMGTNTKNSRAINWLKPLDKIFHTFHLVDYKRTKVVGFENTFVTGIPYSRSNMDLMEIPKPKKKHKNILLIHTELPGASDPSGYTNENIENVKSLDIFRGYKLVLSGHIHKPDELKKGKVFMIGAPYQQRVSDMGCEMGFWKIYSDMSMVFVHLDSLPQFRKKKTKKHNDSKDIFIEETQFKNVTITNDDAIEYESTSTVDICKEYLNKKGITEDKKVKALLESVR